MEAEVLMGASVCGGPMGEAGGKARAAEAEPGREKRTQRPPRAFCKPPLPSGGAWFVEAPKAPKRKFLVGRRLRGKFGPMFSGGLGGGVLDAPPPPKKKWCRVVEKP